MCCQRNEPGGSDPLGSGSAGSSSRLLLNVHTSNGEESAKRMYPPPRADPSKPVPAVHVVLSLARGAGGNPPPSISNCLAKSDVVARPNSFNGVKYGKTRGEAEIPMSFRADEKSLIKLKALTSAMSSHAALSPAANLRSCAAARARRRQDFGRKPQRGCVLYI